MKEVIAIVRSGKVGATKRALAEAGIPSFTCQAVLGRGKQMLGADLAEALASAAGDDAPASVSEALSETMRLVPKRMFTLIVEQEDVDRVVKTVIDVNSTHSAGDGKIFVLPIAESYRVRNGERSADAY